MRSFCEAARQGSQKLRKLWVMGDDRDVKPSLNAPSSQIGGAPAAINQCNDILWWVGQHRPCGTIDDREIAPDEIQMSDLKVRKIK